jgi:hypothetical protein
MEIPIESVFLHQSPIRILMDEFEGRIAALGEMLAEHASQVAGAYEALVGRIDFVEGQLMATQAALRAAIVCAFSLQGR